MSSKPIKQNIKPSAGNSSASKSNKKINVAPPSDFIDSIDRFLDKRLKYIFYITFGLTALFSILLFDVKVGPGGDDSAYILRAFNFVHRFTFPGYQGPLYPLVLSPLILLFGVQLPLLKILSTLFMLTAFIFLYKTFAHRIPSVILTIALFLISINYYLLYFSSQTYSEAFYMMLQFIMFWYFAKYFIDNPSGNVKLRQNFTLAVLLFLLTITKNIAIVSLLAILMYFLINRQWRNASLTFSGFVVTDALFEGIKHIFWPGLGFQLTSQGGGLMYKDFYNHSLGKENFMGFIQRFIDNSNLYFSKHLFKFLGLANETYTGTSLFLTLVVYFLLITAALIALRKNKLILLTALYTLMMCGATFFAVQKQWDQYRLIIIYYPFLLILVFSAFYFIFKRPSFKGAQFLIPLLGILFFFTSFSTTSIHVKSQRGVLSRNLQGDMLYGLTPDWQNYILMSEWAAKHVPRNVAIGCRKPDISFVYGQREFYYIGKVPSITTDSILKLMHKPEVYVGIRIPQIYRTSLFKDTALKARTVGFVNGSFGYGPEPKNDGNVVGIYRFSTDEFPKWQKRFEQANVYYSTNIKKWISNLPAISNEYAVFLPDMLLNQLRKNNVRYLILASLRMNPYVNNGSIITTLQRFVYFIQLKYPDMFKDVYKIGQDESATLVEVDYQ